ncbi:hypothetical protein NIES4072_26350 [Nostoc commune NIES-4072]|uniref:Uncharacterized protein n=1 Tax=Nostoc commune NIES-4072 TaxID=2005467 RepID=A0A2R5FJQ1_NOSCO|nr:hypothetical protein [Nostoc commune]BBD63709.1 hypothetical protein NIES4070_00510 [Nostoc commune HK-02]GBG18970.1 hypothetical protein NIES4072_26350 [Nostoc commune NIES-4072]
MDNNHEIENQDMRPSTMPDDSALANLPGEELSEQNLDAVSGGTPLSMLTQGLSTIEELNQAPPPIENIPGPAGDIVELPDAVGNMVDNVFG